MIALGFVHYLTNEPLNDPRYVKWINMYSAYGSDGFHPLMTHMLHPCTEEDYSRFYPPDKQAE